MASVILPIHMNVTCEFDSWTPKKLTKEFCHAMMVLRDRYGGCFAAYNWHRYNHFAAMYLNYCYGCQQLNQCPLFGFNFMDFCQFIATATLMFVGFFIWLNKKFKKHPYPLIA